MTDPRHGERALSDAEAARIVQEEADVLADDLLYPRSSTRRRQLITYAIARAVERWRIYARGGEQYPKEPHGHD